MAVQRYRWLAGCALIVAALVGCVAPPPTREAPRPPQTLPPRTGPQSLPAPAPVPLPQPVPMPAPARSAAVSSLLEQARASADAANYPSASALLERALRLSPKDAWLWHELARVRLAEGDTAQAAAFAQRSNALAPGDTELRRRNAGILAGRFP